MRSCRASPSCCRGCFRAPAARSSRAFDRAGYRGFDLFFILSGVLSLAALLFLPMITRARAAAGGRSGMIEDVARTGLRARARTAVAAGRIPGAALGVVAADGRRATRVAGMAALLPEPEALTEDHWFDLASVSKVIATTDMILTLARGGPDRSRPAADRRDPGPASI